jgi:hypothetical protein
MGSLNNADEEHTRVRVIESVLIPLFMVSLTMFLAIWVIEYRLTKLLLLEMGEKEGPGIF